MQRNDGDSPGRVSHLDVASLLTDSDKSCAGQNLTDALARDVRKHILRNLYVDGSDNRGTKVRGWGLPLEAELQRLA
jgi:hypothetical protein